MVDHPEGEVNDGAGFKGEDGGGRTLGAATHHSGPNQGCEYASAPS